MTKAADAELENEEQNSPTGSSESERQLTGFTPGPWKAHMAGMNVLACNDQMMICNVRGWGYLTGVGALNLPDDQAIAIQDANTRLIAAAPALYEAAQAVCEAHDNVARGHNLTRCGCTVCKVLRPALALANGQATACAAPHSAKGEK